jgi:hypothetical protein
MRWPKTDPRKSYILITLQQTNKNRKFKLVSNLSKEHPDTFSKKNVEKWNEHLKIINQTYD